MSKMCKRGGGDGDDYRDNKGPGLVVNGAMMEKVELFC